MSGSLDSSSGARHAWVRSAVGISRIWYATLENERPACGDPARIAEALMMDPAERGTLFRLAIPALRSASLTDTSTAILDAFGSLRRLMRRLWAATSEAEALRVLTSVALSGCA